MKKKNNILDDIKRTWVDFKDWLDYVKNQKKHIETVELAENTIDCLKKTIKTLEAKLEKEQEIGRSKDELTKKLDDRIQNLNQKYGMLKQETNALEKEKKQLQDAYNLAMEKIEEKEYQRRANATKIGAKQRKINNLEKELEKANMKINWLQKNQKAPSKEEIMAYETRMKEVEKRLKK